MVQEKVGRGGGRENAPVALVPARAVVQPAFAFALAAAVRALRCVVAVS